MFMIDMGAASYYSILGLAPDADGRAIRASQSNIFADLERQRQKARTAEEKAGLSERQQNINRIGDELSNPARRSKYDQQNVHLTFFQVRKAAAPVWDDRELLLRWLHRAVRDFLLEKGEPVEPVTDLERTDFTADFTPNELLERLLHNERDRVAEHE
jgi:hypothetical protein